MGSCQKFDGIGFRLFSDLRFKYSWFNTTHHKPQTRTDQNYIAFITYHRAYTHLQRSTRLDTSHAPPSHCAYIKTGTLKALNCTLPIRALSKMELATHTNNATRHSQYPVNFSNGVWKYTLVVPSANNQMATRPTVAITAHVCVRDHDTARNDGVTWSARNKIDIVNKNTCPDTSCPLRNLGIVLQGTSGRINGAANKLGCVRGDSRTLERQYSSGTVKEAPEGSATVHSPPESRMNRSVSAGPKNQLVKASQAREASVHWSTRVKVWVRRGLVSQTKRKAKDVQPQARLMNQTLRKLDLLAK